MVRQRRGFQSITPPHAQLQSPLFHMPAEVRNKIWRLYLEEEEVYIGSRNKTENQGLAKPPGLLLTCKQVHTETIRLFYASACFLIGKKSCLRQWLSGIGTDDASLVQNIHLKETHGWTEEDLHYLDMVKEQARMTRVDVVSLSKQCDLKAGVLKGYAQLARAYTVNPLQLVREMLKVADYAYPYGWHWTEEPPEKLRRLRADFELISVLKEAGDKKEEEERARRRELAKMPENFMEWSSEVEEESD